MQPSQWEVLLLKPTPVFLAFLASQLSEPDLPDLNTLQIDTTAYTIRQRDNEEDILDELERHFKFIFRHEICRWLGDEARHEIEDSFLDFLCCFKFKLHSQIVL